MPRSRYRVLSNPCPHFMTATVTHWLPLFTRPETVDIVLDSWRFFTTGIRLSALWLCHPRKSLASDRRVGKPKPRYAAVQIVHGEANYRAFGTTFKRAHKQDTDYQVGEEGNHPQIIESESVMRAYQAGETVIVFQKCD